MTRKDYVMIAEVLRAGINYERDFNKSEESAKAIQSVAEFMAGVLAQDNPRFDRDRFLVASGIYKPCDVCGSKMRYATGQGEWCEAHLPEWAKKIKSQISAIN
jgi:hypothetical protein